MTHNNDAGQDAMVVAVSPDGKQFAVSTDANVNVFHRNADGMFAKVGFSSVKPPVTDQTANAIIFAEEPAKAEATGTKARIYLYYIYIYKYSGIYIYIYTMRVCVWLCACVSLSVCVCETRQEIAGVALPFNQCLLRTARNV